jgi:hypothetical protein
MSKLIVNGSGEKFTVTSKTSEKGTSNFALITRKGTKKVDVAEEIEIDFNDVA